MDLDQALLTNAFRLVERKVIKGERKDHRWAGSNSEGRAMPIPT
jgi:hypothetical protein